jgi:alpha-ketoglutarate-dependent 2,4-dichlorophenoxyacetate dioxygenase
MKVRPIHPRFGVEVTGVDLRELSEETRFPDIRALFEKHSLLLFKGQSLDEDAHGAFARLFGPLEDRDADVAGTAPRDQPPLPVLTNRDEDGDGAMEVTSLAFLNLIANRYWHTDSTFLRTPALINAITAHVVPSSGGETEIASTRAAWQDLPQALKDRAEETVFLHSVLPSRIETDPRLAELPTVNRYQGQAWRAVWPNPVTGEKALYIANHIYGARGMDWTDARAFAEELIAFATRPEYVYAHAWEPGDVLVWDERATMHRVRPWPFEEVRTLASTCVSARERDGLALVTPADGPIRPEEIFQAPGGSSA